MVSSSKQLCTFFVGDLFFGVPVLLVQEVIGDQRMTRVPLAPDVVSGLMNLRGQIVTAVDLRRRLKLVANETGQEASSNVVVRVDDGVVSLLVDEIGDVIDVDESTFEDPPETIDKHARELIVGVYKLEGRLLHELDVENTIMFEHAVVA